MKYYIRTKIRRKDGTFLSLRIEYTPWMWERFKKYKGCDIQIRCGSSTEWESVTIVDSELERP
jgi:hypothetical protein